jgi:hypothetical protein
LRHNLDLYLPKKGVAEAEARVSERTAETRVVTSELVDSHQFFTYGRVSDVFSLVNKIADRVDPLPVRHAFPATQSPAAMRAAQPDPHPPQRSFWAGDYTNPASPAYDPWGAKQMAQYDLKNVPKALIYRELGSIQHIDKTWKFTVVRPVKGVQLRTNDPLHVLYDEGDVYANLRIGTVEKAVAIATTAARRQSLIRCSRVTRSSAGTRRRRKRRRTRSSVSVRLAFAGSASETLVPPCCSSPRFFSPSIIVKTICAPPC